MSDKEYRMKGDDGILKGFPCPNARDTMPSVVMVEVVKIDEETGKSYSHHIPIPRAIKGEKIFSDAQLPASAGLGCNVGDFLIVEGEVYRRIRGGMRPATDDELAELLAAKLGEEDLEET